MAHAMGESRAGLLRVGFDRRLKLEFYGSRFPPTMACSHYCELDDALGLSALASDTLSEVRRGKNGRRLLTEFLRRSVFGRLAGYEVVNDAERLAFDPVIRAIVDRRGLDGTAVWISQIACFETA